MSAAENRGQRCISRHRHSRAGKSRARNTSLTPFSAQRPNWPMRPQAWGSFNERARCASADRARPLPLRHRWTGEWRRQPAEPDAARALPARADRADRCDGVPRSRRTRRRRVRRAEESTGAWLQALPPPARLIQATAAEHRPYAQPCCPRGKRSRMVCRRAGSHARRARPRHRGSRWIQPHVPDRAPSASAVRESLRRRIGRFAANTWSMRSACGRRTLPAS